MSPRGRHGDMGCLVGPDFGSSHPSDHMDRERAAMEHERMASTGSGPPPPISDRLDCGSLGHMVHERLECGPMGHERMEFHCGPMSHERLECGMLGQDRLIEHGIIPHHPHHPHHHERLMDYGPMGPLRMECGPDANMNIMVDSGPGSGLRPLGPLICEDPHGKDECGMPGYGMLHERGCLDLKRPMPTLTPVDSELPGSCAGCGGRIMDRYYLHAVEKQWHTHCLTCSDCHYRLDSEITCFARDGQIYCKTDYYRRFAVKNCSRCQLPISANELIMRAKEQVFHLTCFACSACNRTLKSGEQFGIRDTLLYCRMDYELMFQGDFNLPSMSPGGHSAGSPGGGSLPFYNGVGGVQKGRPRKRKSPMSDGDGCPPLGIGMDGSDRHGDVLDRDGYPHNTPRQKRVRTSFKHHQLRTMKSYFALNHNPDAKDLKQLAQKTGLSKRVLQVWFQNARAKYRRNILKQQDSGDSKQGQNPGSPDGQDNEGKDGGSIQDLNSGSPALSDISSTPSLSDIQSSTREGEHNSSSSNSISDLFSSTIAAID